MEDLIHTVDLSDNEDVEEAQQDADEELPAEIEYLDDNTANKSAHEEDETDDGDEEDSADEKAPRVEAVVSESNKSKKTASTEAAQRQSATKVLPDHLRTNMNWEDLKLSRPFLKVCTTLVVSVSAVICVIGSARSWI